MASNASGRGYRYEQERKEAIRVMVNGMRCPFCHMPMSKRMALDYDHSIPIAMGGINSRKRLSHASCNRSSGASMGNRMRKTLTYVNNGRRSNAKRAIPTRNASIAIRRRLPKW